MTTLPIAAISPPSGSAPAVLLMGAPGSGKSWALSTLVECDLDLFIVGTEPRFADSVLDSAAARKLDPSRIHYKTIQPMRASFDSMISAAKLINQLSYEALSEIKSGITKSEYGQFVVLLQTLSNFIDERTGEVFGPVDSWGPDRVLCLDSLTGVNLMSLDLAVGAKPVRHQGEWGIAMDNEERLINKLSSDLRCPFVLTAHVDRELNEITGGVTVQVGALGRKLAPKLPRFFSEVIHTRREGDKYLWSTITPSYELKRRVLPLSDKLEPHFHPIIDAWRKRNTGAKS